jgi:prolyl 4-hydroxylase
MKDYKIIDNFLPSRICRSLISLSESKGYDEADISYTGGSRMEKDRRNNSRVLHEDETLRMMLDGLIWEHAPKDRPFILEGGILSRVPLVGLSGRFRFYRYFPGEKFKKHRDGNAEERGGVSLVTVLIYLNTPEKGGETFLCDWSLEYQPRVEATEGRCLMFDHSLIHTGEPLLEGVKYVLRTDLVYEDPRLPF